MSEIGAAKVMTNTGPVWCHFSQGEKTVKLRRYAEGAIFELPSDDYEIEEFVPQKECENLILAKTPSYTNVKVWTEILRMLETGVAPPPTASTGRAKRPPITVPITILRQFYETMNLLETATWVNLAEFYSENPEWLERLWKKSRKAFSSYKNNENWGRTKIVDLPSPPKKVGSIKSTNEFTVFIKKGGNSCSTKTGYTFVERELNPRRTRLGKFSDKRPATKSGAGGINVVLKSCETGFPAVGEVKVGNDKNAFFALVQAMTYAVELSTPNQLGRLRTHYGVHFGNLNLDQAKVEIVLLMVNHVEDKTRAPVLKLIETLNGRVKCEGLGKVVLVENDGEEWICHS